MPDCANTGISTCKPCCLQTCNYDHSLVATHPQNFNFCYYLLFELWVSNEKKKKKQVIVYKVVNVVLTLE